MLEQDFEDVIQKYPELIEPGLALLGRQVTRARMRIDLLFRDRHGQTLIVELKRGAITRGHILQIMDYEGELLTPDDPTVRVMLVGTRVPPSLQRSLDHHGIEWREIPHRALASFLHEKGDVDLLARIAADFDAGQEEASQRFINGKRDRPAGDQTQSSGGPSIPSNRPDDRLRQSGEGKKVTIKDKILHTFQNVAIGTKFSRSSIIQHVIDHFPDTNRSSVIPSDYCYNIVNQGIPFKFHIFKYIQDAADADSQYEYLGPDYPYVGEIRWKGEVVGEWVRGEKLPRKNDRWPWMTNHS